MILVGVAGASSIGATTGMLFRAPAWIATLFSRIQKAKGLDDPCRQEILGVIEATPGIGFCEVTGQLGLARGALDGHLRRFKEASIVRLRKGGQRMQLWPAAIS